MSADVTAMLDHNEPGDVILRGAGAEDCRGMSIWVRLDRMKWGGQYLPVPCTFAHGLVIDYEDVNEGLDLDALAVWVVDFGAHFGVQRIGELDCELIRPHRRRQGGDGEEGALHAAPEDWAPLDEGATTNHLHINGYAAEAEEGGGVFGEGQRHGRAVLQQAERGHGFANACGKQLRNGRAQPSSTLSLTTVRQRTIGSQGTMQGQV
jgi:hypothetical protein